MANFDRYETFHTSLKDRILCVKRICRSLYLHMIEQAYYLNEMNHSHIHHPNWIDSVLFQSALII